MTEHVRRIDVFGGSVELRAAGRGRRLDAPAALMVGATLLRGMHHTLTRFDPASELSRLNADPRDEVPASRLLCRVAAAVREAGERSGGLVDATQLDALEAAGYVTSRRPAGVTPLRVAQAPHPRPALPDPRRRWEHVGADMQARVVRRPAGTRIDSGGLAKGLATDLLANLLGDHEAFAIACLGDVRVGGHAGRTRPVEIADPFGSPRPVAVLRMTAGAVATSGVTARANHIIDPGRGVPAWTGVLQASAVAPTGLQAEIRAKAALLAGPERAHEFLPDGGVLVLADGSVVEHAAAVLAA